jgi:NTP pyrophosphatase (non-canonical NTP hydrolase)
VHGFNVPASPDHDPEHYGMTQSSDIRSAVDFLAHLRDVNSERLAAWEQPEPIMLCEHCGRSSPSTTTMCAPPFDVQPHNFTRPHPHLTREPRKTDGIFHAVELGGEVGEVLNVVKKLHREEMGWRGSRASKEQLAEEIGDVLICLDKLAAHYGIDLAEATARKFNATSEKVGLPHRLIEADMSHWGED